MGKRMEHLRGTAAEWHWVRLSSGSPSLSVSISHEVNIRGTPHPVIVVIRDNRDYIRVLSYSYYTTITGWGVLLR